jgi:two-component system cell cycle sensor histidine kinase/response regulator CckA
VFWPAVVGLSLSAAVLLVAWSWRLRRALRARDAQLQALRADCDDWRHLVDSMPQVVWVARPDGAIYFANKHWLDYTGLTLEENEKGGWAALIHPDDQEAAVRAWVESVTKCQSYEVEARVRGTDGVYRWWLVRALPVVARGALLKWFGTCTDIDLLKRAELERESLEAQVRESQKMEAIGTLAGGVAHDFNNMLGVILGNVQLAVEDAGDNPSMQRSLDEIRKAGRRARELVRQILTFSRREPMSRRFGSLQPIIEESIRLMRAILPAQVEIGLRVSAAGVPPVLVDALQVQQVLLNLGTNAVHAMEGAPGRIDLCLEPVTLDAESMPGAGRVSPGHYVRLSCIDTGRGMDAMTLQHIFEPFFTTKPVGEGTGLGLSVAHGIMSAHEGSIVALSEPGRGSRFDLYFPVALPDDGNRPAVPGDRPVAAPAVGLGQHVLYIDDEEGLVLLVKRMLQRRGYRVSGYVDPRSALEALRADPAGFDLVVTDQNMPGMTGLDVVREVRATRPGLAIAIASGNVTEALREKALAAGVCALIPKADVVEEFCDVLERLLPAQIR